LNVNQLISCAGAPHRSDSIRFDFGWL
jgi:hypothetical protein